MQAATVTGERGAGCQLPLVNQPVGGRGGPEAGGEGA